MAIRARSLPLLAACVLGAAPLGAQARAAESAIAFVNVSVVPMDGERVLANQTVLVRGDRIVALGPSATVQVPPGARRVAASGKFLVPGVAEMHAHLQPQGPVSLNERLLFLYVAHGVTTVRGMLGAPAHLLLRARAARGEIVSPTIYTSGPSLNGRSVPDPRAARALVTLQREAGYDFLKIHPGIGREAFDTLAATATRLGMRFSGHVPAAVGLERALEARYASIDHLDGYVEFLAGPGAGPAGFFGVAVAGVADETRIADAVRRTKESGVWVVPTQSLMETFLGPAPAESLAARPEMRYMPPAMVAQWTQQRRGFQSQAPQPPGNVERFLALRRKLLRELHRAGVGIALGSDAPQVFMVPGYSVRAELRSYVEAGLTPYEALETGTRNVARFFGAEEEFGTIAVGRRADLVLLDANPLADIGNFARQAGVMVRGRWLPAEEIARRLAAYSATPAGG